MQYPFLINLGLFIMLGMPVIYGQKHTFSNTIPTIYIADLDRDGLQDTLKYDSVKQELIFILSREEYVARQYIGQYLDAHLPFDSQEINVFEGGFSIRLQNMRASSREEYKYEEATGKFRLDYLEYEHHGFGYMVYEGKKSLFTGNWWFKHTEGKPIILPEAKLSLEDVFYWEDSPDIFEYGTALFEQYQSVYQPEKTERIRFAGIQTEESDNIEFLEYITQTGAVGIYDAIYCNYPQLTVDDEIEIKTGTHFYVEPGDRSWHAVRGIVEINIINK